jgi:hypothetical protein
MSTPSFMPGGNGQPREWWEDETGQKELPIGRRILTKFDNLYQAAKEDQVRRIQDYMTIAGAVEFLGVSASTLRNWDRAGKLKAARNPMNRYRLYEKSDLEEVLLSLQPSRRKAAKGKKTGIAVRRSARRRRISDGWR